MALIYPRSIAARMPAMTKDFATSVAEGPCVPIRARSFRYATDWDGKVSLTGSVSALRWLMIFTN